MALSSENRRKFKCTLKLCPRFSKCSREVMSRGLINYTYYIIYMFKLWKSSLLSWKLFN